MLRAYCALCIAWPFGTHVQLLPRSGSVPGSRGNSFQSACFTRDLRKAPGNPPVHILYLREGKPEDRSREVMCPRTFNRLFTQFFKHILGPACVLNGAPRLEMGVSKQHLQPRVMAALYAQGVETQRKGCAIRLARLRTGSSSDQRTRGRARQAGATAGAEA